MQRDDQACRVESMEGIEFGGRSRRGETDDTRTVLLYGSSVPDTKPA